MRKKRPRDTNGWSIPLEGTMKRRVYDFMIEGILSNRQIAERIGRSRSYVSVTSCQIRNPDQYTTAKPRSDG